MFRHTHMQRALYLLVLCLGLLALASRAPATSAGSSCAAGACLLDDDPDEGAITVTKMIAGGGDPNIGFEFTPSWAGSFTLKGGELKTFSGLAPGDYAVSEATPLPAHWSLHSATCTNQAIPDAAPVDPSQITLVGGDDWLCVFTNLYTAPGTITIVKEINGGGDPNTSFEFDPSWSGSNFTLIGGQSATSGTLAPGVYSVSEVAPLPAGWSQQNAACDNAVTTGVVETIRPNRIELGENDAWVCTFINRYTAPAPGTITVKKAITGNGDPNTGFEFAGSWSTIHFVLKNGQSKTTGPLPPGIYSAYEVTPLPAGWSLQSAACDNRATPAVEQVNPAQILVANGDDWRCTFTNRYATPGKITVIKATTGNGNLDTGFEFAASWGPNFTLKSGQSKSSGPLVAGKYSVGEVKLPAGWTQQSATCDNLSTSIIENANPIQINVSDGSDWLCTFTNRYTTPGTITVAKMIIGSGNPDAGFEFNPSWGGAFTLKGGQSKISGPLTPGTYSVSEVHLPSGWSQQSATCDNLSTANVETADPGAIVVANGDAWRCTFTNRYTAPGSITVAKVITGGGNPDIGFVFSPSWGDAFTLKGGQSKASGLLTPGTYSVSEVMPLPDGWSQSSAVCENTVTHATADPSRIILGENDAWVCTFTNLHTAPPVWTLFLPMTVGEPKISD